MIGLDSLSDLYGLFAIGVGAGVVISGVPFIMGYVISALFQIMRS